MEIEARARNHAEKLLAAQFREFSLIRKGRRASVFRGQLGTGRSVVAKLYDSDVVHSAAETVALDLLKPFGLGFIPSPVALDSRNHLLIMDDLGGTTSESVLQSDDHDAAVASLVASAGRLATLHATHFLDVDTDPTTGLAECRRQADEFRDLIPKLGELLDQYSIVPAPGFEEELEKVAARISKPTGWLTLTHGDLAPSNILMTNGGPAFVDFEFSEFRHALYDTMYWQMICPFPEHVRRAMTDAYFETLQAALGRTLDRRAFDDETQVLCSHRIWWYLTLKMGEILEEDEDWVPEWSTRSAYVTYLKRYISVVGSHPVLPALAETARRVLSNMHARWPDADDLGQPFKAFVDARQ